MAQYKQNLLPDEMQDIPPGVDVNPWIGPNDNIITIGTPDGPRYIRDNTANIFKPQAISDIPPGPPPPQFTEDNPDWEAFNRMANRPFNLPPSSSNVNIPLNKDGSIDYRALQADQRVSDFNAQMKTMEETSRANDPFMKIIDRNAAEREARQAEFDKKWGPEATNFSVEDMTREPYTGPTNFTNIPGTADQWDKEGKAFRFLTNTPEETAVAKTKGYGKWGRIIGPPEAAVTTTKAKPESPFPGPPVPDEQIQGYKDFSKFWDTHVQQAYGGNDPMKINPANAKKAAEDTLKKGNEQFIYDYEKYGANQMGPDAKARYDLLQKHIKEAGDLAEKQATNAYHMASRDQTTALQFFKEKTKIENKSPSMATVESAQKYTQNLREGKDSWKNYVLTPEQIAELPTDKNGVVLSTAGVPAYSQLKPNVLSDVNRVRAKAGLPQLAEENVPISGTESAHTFGPFGWGEKISTRPGYRYNEKPGNVSGQALDQTTAQSLLRQSGWDGISQPNETQKNAARALAKQKGYRTQ